MKKAINFLSANILKIGIGILLIFIPLYPKLPSINIPHTWVYVRLEDFLIAIVVIIWLIKLILGRVKPPSKVWIPFAIYWGVGAASLVFSLIFLAPHLANFFPNVAVFFYLRHIEYTILFFVAFSTIKNKDDLKHYLIILSVAVILFSLYAFGQRFYLNLWAAFPDFFRSFTFCFPSFQTGNEEFAKGIPLCLPEGGRINSTFAGHYDLAAYMVLVIPIFLTLIFTLRNNIHRFAALSLTVVSIMVLIFTASRISFAAYIIAITVTLVLIGKKKFIIPFYILSLILLLTFSSSTAKRFLETFRVASVVTNNAGQVVGEAELPEDLKKKVAENNILANEVTQNLPAGTGYLGLPQLKAPEETDKAILRKALSVEEAKRLQLENGGVEISTVSGSFLIKKVLVYDISFTTRFQAEWPNAWNAMLRNPLLGSGFATITLAADNNYLRILGETGLLGLASFIFIFIIIGIIFKQALKTATGIHKGYLYAMGGAFSGLFFNAVLIDVFEASKVAETMWILLGIAVGVAFTFRKNFEFTKPLVGVLTSRVFIFFYLLFIGLIFYLASFKNFFVADDFTWLKWAATTNFSDLPKFFIDSQGFFYRPLDKIVMYFLYTFFSFGQQGYHIFNFAIHFAIALFLYIFIYRLFKNKVYSFAAAFIFLFIPSSFENVYWISTLSTNLAAFFVILGLLFWQRFREKNSVISYLLTILVGICALASHEMAVVFPALVFILDLLVVNIKLKDRVYLQYIPLAALIPLYYYIRSISNVVPISGDYAYNIANLIPNFVGNFVGYFSFMLLGPDILPLYTKARELLREQSLYVVSILVVVGLILTYFILQHKERVRSMFTKETARYAGFAFLFIFISLTPYLGLGNLAPRYSYLASFGFAFLMLIFLRKLESLVKNASYKKYAILLFVLILGVVYFVQDKKLNAQWQEAGRITYRTLGYLRLYYDGKRPNTSFYFADVPIKKGNAWVWPVGLPDGIWFIYRDDSIRVYILGTVEDGENALRTGNKESTYVFTFDKDGNIYAIK